LLKALPYGMRAIGLRHIPTATAAFEDSATQIQNSNGARNSISPSFVRRAIDDARARSAFYANAADRGEPLVKRPRMSAMPDGKSADLNKDATRSFAPQIPNAI
jgi:hypothetical protein